MGDTFRHRLAVAPSVEILVEHRRLLTCSCVVVAELLVAEGEFGCEVAPVWHPIVAGASAGRVAAPPCTSASPPRASLGASLEQPREIYGPALIVVGARVIRSSALGPGNRKSPERPNLSQGRLIFQPVRRSITERSTDGRGAI